VQGAGKADINFQTLGVDSISLTAHKLGGPQGIGALVYDPALNLKPLIRGGGQEMGRRPGTPNISGASSFAAAAQVCMETMDKKTEKLNALRDKMECAITQRYQQVQIASSSADRLAGTSRIILPNVTAETQIMYLDLAGICVSSGAACSSGVAKSSRSLEAMGYDISHSGCSIRVGMSWQTTDDDIDTFIKTYGKMVAQLSK
jgi:cysteine desulfurase